MIRLDLSFFHYLQKELGHMILTFQWANYSKFEPHPKLISLLDISGK